MPFFAKPIAKAHLGQGEVGVHQRRTSQAISNYMEAELGKSEWFAGDEFTGADIQMSFVVEAAQRARRARCKAVRS